MVLYTFCLYVKQNLEEVGYKRGRQRHEHVNFNHVPCSNFIVSSTVVCLLRQYNVTLTSLKEFYFVGNQELAPKASTDYCLTFFK